MIVTMHFGDGTSKDIDVTATDPEKAVTEAKDWVKDNAWFEAMHDDGQNVAATENM